VAGLLDYFGSVGKSGGSSSVSRGVGEKRNLGCQTARNEALLGLFTAQDNFTLNQREMSHPIPALASVFSPWKSICDKYDVICEEIPRKYPSKVKADEKEESIHWEQIAFELIITLLLGTKIPFETTAADVQRIVKSTEKIDKEIDFSIRVKGEEIYFGVTSFRDSEKDFSKDVNTNPVNISDVTYSDGTFSKEATISSFRPHSEYLNRRLAVRVATEGKHKLDCDYIYIVFPKTAIGFGGGLDAISKDFSFSDSNYNYPTNGITGLVVIGEYINIQPKGMFIENGIWLVKTIAFPHASSTTSKMLAELDNITVDMRAKFQEIREMLATEKPSSPNQ
jgi:hypothetical protein